MTDVVSRRQFLGITVAAGAGLVLGVQLPAPAEAGEAALAPNAFVRVGLDGAVTVVVKHLEMGQGVNTGLPAIVAEELAVPWRSIRVEAAPADAARYNNLLFGRMQGTGGSTATANSYLQLRRAAAAAREMLLDAAASRLKVSRSDLVAAAGQVTHPPSGRAIAYGKLAAAAARLPVPQDPPLKDPKDFTIIGKDGAVRRTDSRAKRPSSALMSACPAWPPRWWRGRRCSAPSWLASTIPRRASCPEFAPSSPFPPGSPSSPRTPGAR